MSSGDTIQIPATVDDVFCEELLREGHSRAWDFNIEVPTALVRVSLVSYVRLIQTIGTWSTFAPPNQALRTDIRDEATLQRFLATDHGLASLLTRRQVQAASGHDIRANDRSIQQALWARRRRMDRWDTAHKGRTLTVCATHPSVRPPNSLTPVGSDKVRTSDDLAHKIGAAVKQHVLLNDSLPDEANILRKLGAVVHHLFQNTTEWGCRLPSGEPTKVSFQFVHIAAHRSVDTNITNPKSPLFRYIFRDVALGGLQVDAFIELSVLDIGPTLGSHRLAQMGLSTETADSQNHWTAINWALTDGNSTDPKPPSPLKGRGIALSLDDLEALRAAMTLRTGPIMAASNFSSRKRDRRLTRLQGDYAYAAGTAWSFLIPLRAQ